jgi:hypothetical protein
MKKQELEQEVFEREISMCEKLARDNNGRCNWGTCKNCGVIPLLYKLHKAVLLESADEVQSVKEDHLFAKQ